MMQRHGRLISATYPGHSRQLELREQFILTRRATESLTAGLSAEDCALQSMPDASPVKWHLAHTSWFFETFVLAAAMPGYEPFHPQFRMLYNSYYVQVGARHARSERGLISRPSLDEVRAYRGYVEERVHRWMASDRIAPEFLDLFELGLHHEQQHQELILTDLKHLFSRNPLRPAYSGLITHERGSRGVPDLQWISCPSGLREVGHSRSEFCFDNERPRHRVFLGGFELASRLVTNREYLQFMQDGGYERAELWLSDGWDMRTAQDWSAPLYWEREAERWRVFTLHGMRDLDRDEPVCHVSYYEADAYARWAGARLATEAEWETLSDRLPIEGNFVESGRFHPAAAQGRDGSQQLYGDLWEWTGSAYLPYPGYRPAAGAVGEYNGKFMVNQFVLRGGSCATPHSHVRASYRNFFPASARWQFSGIRLARDAR